MANIFIAILFAMMLSYIVLLGFVIDNALESSFPDEEPVGLFICYILQSLPTLNIESYIHLPIKRNTLVNFVIFKSLVNIFNATPLLFYIPVALQLIIPYKGSAEGLSWLVAVILMVLGNNFLITYFNRQLVSKAWISGIIALIIASVALLDYFSIWSLRDASREFFSLMASTPIYILIPLAWVLLTYILNFRFLSSRLYPEKVNSKKAIRVDRFTGARYFESLGLVGEIMTLEIKLWMRHERTKSMIYMLPQNHEILGLIE